MNRAVYFVCAAFCAAVLGLAFVLERGAAAASRAAAAAADQGVASAFAGWDARGAPASERILTVFVGDALDGDDAAGTGPSWTDLLMALIKTAGRSGAARRPIPDPPGATIDWRTQTLAWAADRDAQYDAIARSLAAAKRAGVKVQVVARGRGAETLLAGLRRAGGAPPDRILIVGRRPEAGDEKLAADVAFVYPAPDGAEAVYTGADGRFVRASGGSVDSLLAAESGALVRGVPFRDAPPAAREGLALPLAPSIGGSLGSLRPVR